MSTLYVNTQGAVLRKAEHRFLVSKENTVLIAVPDFKVDKIIVYGNVQITTQAFRFALKNDIPIIFLTMYGRFLGSTFTAFSKNIFLRLSQFKSLSDDDKRLFLGKKIVYAKIKNAVAMLKRFFRNTPFEPINLEEMRMQLNLVNSASSAKRLMGIEGASASIYFSNLRLLLKEYIEFNGRNYHPAKDPFNSLLNFLYSLLANEVLAALYSKGLDPYLGFLHSTEYGRVSLVFDLMEPFRPCISDVLTVRLFKRSVITAEDFDRHPIYGFVLKAEKRKLVLANYEEMMDKKFSYSGRAVNFREEIAESVANFSEYLTKGTEFTPFTIIR